MTSRRNKLNDKQIQILKLLYKFRFASGNLIAEYKGITRIAAFYSLKILLDQKLIGRRYDNNYKIQGRGASYYLSADGLRFLRDNYKLNEAALRNMRKNTTVSDDHVDECLNIMAVYLKLRGIYPDTFNIFTKSELGDFDYFPESKPNLYLSRKKPLDGSPDEYMLDIITDPRRFITKKRIDAYISHYDSGDWGEEEYPTILLVCPDSRSEENAQKYIETLLEDFDFLTTTKSALLDKHNKETAIWTDVFEPDELLSL